MTRCLVLLIALSFAATVALGDEWDDAMAVPGTVAAVPEHLWFPYVSTYYVKPVTFTGNIFRDNPVNDGLFFCAGHNFVVERNRGDLWILNRTYSPCVRSNDVGVALYENGGRMRAGYGRFEGNRYSTGVSYTSDGPDGWTHLPDRKSRCIPWGWAFRTLKGRIRNGRLK